MTMTIDLTPTSSRSQDPNLPPGCTNRMLDAHNAEEPEEEFFVSDLEELSELNGDMAAFIAEGMLLEAIRADNGRALRMFTENMGAIYDALDRADDLAQRFRYEWIGGRKVLVYDKSLLAEAGKWEDVCAKFRGQA